MFANINLQMIKKKRRGKSVLDYLKIKLDLEGKRNLSCKSSVLQIQRLCSSGNQRLIYFHKCEPKKKNDSTDAK